MIKTKSPSLLKSVKNLQGQLKAISAHLHSHGLCASYDDCHPFDLCNASEIHEKTHDLLRDYAVLHLPVVANSTTWINMWVESKAIQENTQLIIKFLCNSVCPELWAKARGDHQEFHLVQQGRPDVLPDYEVHPQYLRSISSHTHCSYESYLNPSQASLPRNQTQMKNLMLPTPLPSAVATPLQAYSSNSPPPF